MWEQQVITNTHGVSPEMSKLVCRGPLHPQGSPCLAQAPKVCVESGTVGREFLFPKAWSLGTCLHMPLPAPGFFGPSAGPEPFLHYGWMYGLVFRTSYPWVPWA